MMLEIRLLGELEILRGGERVALPASKKSRALLAYLVATGRPHLRDRLCDLLWEGPDDPRAALRWSLAKIRPLVADADATRLVTDRERVSFAPSGAIVDLQQLDDMVRDGALEEAAALIRGELLEGLDLPACYRFQQWLAGEREAMRQRHASLLELLTDRLAGTEAGLVYARRAAMIDPFREEPHATLIRALAASGRHPEALAHYEHCRLLFERELHARPSAIIEDARREIGHAGGQRPSPGLRPPSPAAAGEGTEGAMVGRQRELREIDRLVDSTLHATNAKIVLIAGEPGIGKSRLLLEARQRMRAREGVALYARAFASEMMRPYGVWIDALRSAAISNVPEPLRKALAPLLPELGTPEREQNDRERLFEAVVELLLLTGSRGALLALDDLQWFDEGSLALLHYVSRAIRGTPISIVCTARWGELHDNAAATRLVRELTSERMLVRLMLEPLSVKETRDLASRVAPDADIDRVVSESAGNPLFTIELARVAAPSDGDIQSTLGQLLGERLASLDPAARALVPWAAAVGRHFDVEVLGRATGMPAGEMMAALEALERGSVIRAGDPQHCYDFTHDLLRDAAYQTLSGPRKWLVHREIARALDDTHDPDGTLAGEIFHHASLGGDARLAARAAIAAGRRGLRLFAYGEAAAIAREGLQLADTLPAEEGIPIAMELLHVLVVLRTPLTERAPWRPRIEALLAAAQERQLAGAAALGAHLLAILAAEREDVGGAMTATLQSASIGRDADAATTAATFACTARCLLSLQREIDRARSLLAEAEALVRHTGIENADIPLGLGYLAAHNGDAAKAAPLLERAFVIAARDQDHWREWMAISRLVTLALEHGDNGAAMTHAARLCTISEKMRGGSEGPVSQTLHALACRGLGQSADVDAKLALLRDIDNKGDLAYALVRLAELDHARGDAANARRRAEEALALAEQVARHSEAAAARSVLARIALSEGRLTEGRDLLRPMLHTRGWDDLTAHARETLTSAAAALRMSKTKERRDGDTRTRAGV